MPTRPLRAILIFASLSLAFFLPLLLNARPPQINSFNAERVKIMLRQAHDDLRKNYYDKSIRGLDWDARYQEFDGKIRQAGSLGQGFTIVAAFLDVLNDSHTFFAPPPRPVRLDYGFQWSIVGDKRFVLRVRPGTDAESKLHPGDEVIAVNKYSVNRASLWKMDYYFKLLAPQPQLLLVVKDPKGVQRTVQVETKIVQRKRVLDLTQGDDFIQMIRESESEAHQLRHRYYEKDEVMLWKMPNFDGGLNRSTQYSGQTQLALKTKAKSLARVGSAGTLPWLGFDRVQSNRSLLLGKHCRINALDGVASTV